MSRSNAIIGGATNGMGRLAQSLAFGGKSEEDAFLSSAGAQSKIMQALAAAQKDRIESDAAQTKAGILAGRPALYDEQVALMSGQSVPAVRAYRQFVQTGQMPQMELQGPATEYGGALLADAVPEVARGRIATALQRMMPLVSDSGDIGMKGLADAIGAYQQQDRNAAVRSGALDLPTVGQQEAALKGQPLLNVAEFGTTNPFTGQQDTSGPAAQRFGDYRKATTSAQQANARQSDAAAGKDRREVGGVKLAPNYVWGPPDSEGNPTMIPIKGSPADQKIAGAFNADTAQLAGSTASLDRLAVAANETLNHPGLSGIYGLRGMLPNIPGGAAADAAALLNTLKSQVGFGVLQDMRNNSKTGGALGAVSDKENAMLQANLAALEKAQSVDQARASLKKIIAYTEGAKDRLRVAFNLRHGGQVPAGSGITAPAASEVKPKGIPLGGGFMLQQ